MSVFSKSALFAVVALAMSGCAPEPATPDDDPLGAFRAAIRAQYDLKERAFADDDADRVVEQFYSEDVLSVDHEGHVHSGRDALRAVYREVVPPHTVEVQSLRSHVDGNSGWDWANFRVTPDDPQAEPFSFVILFLWQQRDDKWWCVGDFYVPGELPADIP